jgi:nicotinate-nucleotide pyrophosphorylase (carboxylating)
MDACTLPGVEALLAAALNEDLGRGDVTTRLTVPAERSGAAFLTAKQAAVVAGLPLVESVFRLAGGGVEISFEARDGDSVSSGTILCRLRGPARVMLSGERVALNFLQQLSGVATLTRRFVEAVAGTRARIADTRKTVPGLRVLQKYAVRLGGGSNHRSGLDDGILIKDNHIAAAGGLSAAVRAARAGAPHGLKVEVECETLAQVDDAIASGADMILLDNMTPEQMRQGVARIGGRALVEASGGIRLDNVRSVAETGVDVISVGALTHSAPAVDISMGWEPFRSRA